MGLERVAFLKQGVENMYEIDQVRPVLDRAAALSGRRYGADHDDDVRMRIVADHVRSSLMLMSDGVTPSNEGRGYILRRLMRRSVRAMRLLGVDDADVPRAVPRLARRDEGRVPRGRAPTTTASARRAFAEEETFLRTLASGTQRARPGASRKTKSRQHDRARRRHRVPAARHLRLPDRPHPRDGRRGRPHASTATRSTRSWPKQRTTAKADAKAKKTHLADLSVYSEFRALGETVFTGYDRPADRVARSSASSSTAHSVTSAVAGEIAEVILAETALYAESGGQEADAASSSAPATSSRCSTCRSPSRA